MSEIQAKAPPHDLDTEESVLASMLIDNDCINDAIDVLSDNDFYKKAHQYIYECICDVYKQKKPADLVTVSKSLRDNGYYDSVGGAAYLSRLIDHVPYSTNFPHYAKILKELSVRRKFMVVGNEIIKRSQDMQGKIENIIEKNQKEVISIDVDPEGVVHSVNNLAFETVDRYERIFNEKRWVTGVPTGFDDFDNLTCGLQPSDLFILAARPSMGKTALALQMIHGAAVAKHKCLMFSLEQPKEQLIDRMVANRTRMSTVAFRSGSWGRSAWSNINEAIGHISKLPISIDDRGALSYKEIRKVARREKRINGVDLIVVDHLQLVRGAGNKSRNDEVGVYTREFKAMAKELKVPVIVLSQLSRLLEQRTNKRPILSDLRDSGNIEQDADLVSFIYRDEVYNPDGPNVGKAELITAKQRQGPIGVTHLVWIARSTRFEPLAREDEDENANSDTVRRREGKRAGGGEGVPEQKGPRQIHFGDKGNGEPAGRGAVAGGSRGGPVLDEEPRGPGQVEDDQPF